MAKHRTHSIEFKRQVAQELLGGETVYALAKRHGLSRHLISATTFVIAGPLVSRSQKDAD